MRVPAPLAGRLIGNGEGGGEQVFDWGLMALETERCESPAEAAGLSLF